jgi:hypothetical protein
LVVWLQALQLGLLKLIWLGLLLLLLAVLGSGLARAWVAS